MKLSCVMMVVMSEVDVMSDEAKRVELQGE
jgi:hypothetical protein